MGIITIYVLIADDFRLLVADKNSDEYFFITILACIGIFFFEIFLLSIFRKGYIFSFFFWMDLISTFSTFLEVPWILNDLLGL